MTDLSIFAGLAAGVVSFLSPCVLPLVPGDLAFVSSTGAPAASEPVRARVRHSLERSAVSVPGFSTIFIELGASATQIGPFSRACRPYSIGVLISSGQLALLSAQLCFLRRFAL
ncbi:MAG: cytochrome c biogenesis CcdA family protein [Gemmatimonadaceae bacterium]